MVPFSRFALFLLLSFSLFSAISAQQVKSGSLPSGLRYTLVSDSSWSSQKAEIRLVVPVGSLSEEDPSGVAHFIEHLAFRGSTHFKDLGMQHLVERHGGAFGYDLNALTGYDRTIYMLSLPSDTFPKLLDSTLLMLKDWLRGLSFTPKAIDIERKVIINEIEQYIPNDTADDLMIGDGIHKRRFPLGNREDVQRVNRADLIAFYKKWYQPSLAYVIIASAMDIDEIEQGLIDCFSSLPPCKPMERPIYPPLQYSKKATFRTTQDSLYTTHHLRYITPFKSLSSYEERLLSHLFNELLDRVSGVSLSIWHYLTGTSMMELSIRSTNEEEIERKLRKSLQLFERVRVSGLQQNETYLNSLYKSFPIPKPSFASPLGATEEIVESLFDNVSISSFSLDQLAQQILSSIRTEIIVYNQGKDAHLQAEDFYINSIDPLDSIPHLEREESNVRREEIELKDVMETLPVLYEEEIKPCRVQTFPILGLVVATYPKNHKLVIKQTSEETRVFSQSPGGVTSLPSQLFQELASIIDMEDNGEALLAEGLALGSTLGNTYHGFYGYSEREKGLSRLLAYIYYKIKNAEATIGIDCCDSTSFLQKLIERNPSHQVEAFRDTILCHVSNLPQGSRAIPADTVSLYYRLLYGDIANGTTIVTTSLPADSVIDAFGKTIAHLTTRNSFAQDYLPCSLPSPYIPIIPNEGMLTVHYLSFGMHASSLRSHLILKIIREALRTQQLAALRHEEGIVYSPAVSVEFRNNVYLLELENNTNVGSFAKLRTILEKLVEEISLSEERLEEIKRAFLSNRKTALANADASEWIAILLGLQDRGESIEDFEDYEAIIESITSSEVLEYWKELQKHMRHQWI